MITIITGLPGGGKSLYTITRYMQIAKADNRPVFVSGIPGLSVPDWQVLERGEDWYKCPPSSIVIIDEAQRVFRPRNAASAPPQHVVELETHRHGGIDLVLITQHPRLIDVAVKSLAEDHFHVIRAMGFEASTVHKWKGVQNEPASKSARRESEKINFKYDKSVYALYKSAEVHTVKARIPPKVYFGLSLFVIIPALIYGGVRYVQHSQNPELKRGSGQQEATGVIDERDGRRVEPVLSWYEMRASRIKGLPHTAPVYDEVTKPVTAPRPAACVQSAKQCVCYTQQATMMYVADDMCQQIVKHGYFDDWGKPDHGMSGSGGVNGV